MTNRPLSERLYEQLQLRRKQSDEGQRQLAVSTGQIYDKDAFWIGTAVMLFLICTTVTGIAYLVISRNGIPAPQVITQIPDPRWGYQYNTPDAPITSMVMDNRNVFVGTVGNGLHVYDRASRFWTTISWTEQQDLFPHDKVRWLKFDEIDQDKVWAFTRNGGAGFTSGNHRGAWATVFGGAHFSGLQDLTTAARNGSLISVGTPQGLGIYDLRVRSWVAQLNRENEPSLPADHINIVRTGHEDRTFWAGTQRGLVRMDGSIITHTFLADSIYNDVVNLETEPDGVWYLTGNDVSIGRIDRENNLDVRLKSTPLPFTSHELTAAAQDGDMLWTGTRRQGVHRYNLETHQWQPVRIPVTDSSTVTGITALAFNTESRELFVGSDTGLQILPREQAIKPEPSDAIGYAGFRNVTDFQIEGTDTYFLTDDGKLGLRQGDKDNQRWWQFLARDDQKVSDVATLVDVSAAHIDPEDITATCQSDEYLYFGTLHGDIVWYHKPSHSWSTINIPLPYAIVELVYNPYTGSVVALAGHALYRSPPTLDAFILYLSIPTDDVKIVPTPTGYLIFADSRILTHFDETTNHRDPLLAGNTVAEPAFEPVSVDRVGSMLYFVTQSGRVLTYDTLRHRWDRPAEFPDSGVTDVRGIGYRTVYQTSDKTLHVSGSFPLIGGGTLGLSDTEIRRAAANQRHVWVAGDRIIGRYDKGTHTWQRRKRVDLGDRGAPSHMVPVGGKIVYRTGPTGYNGSLWMEDRQMDRSIGSMTGASGRIWYLKNNGLYRLRMNATIPSRMLDRRGIRKTVGERLISATEVGSRLWLATNRRLLTYNMQTRTWRRAAQPHDRGVTQLWHSGHNLYGLTAEGAWRISGNAGRWKRISPVDQRVRDLSISSYGATLLLENDRVQHVPTERISRDFPLIDIRPDDAAVPIDLANLITAHQDTDYLTIVTARHILQYNTHTHTWDEPRSVAGQNMVRAIVRDNHLWATTADGSIVTGFLNGPFEAMDDSSTRTLALDIQEAINGDQDEIWIDTPLWRWERIQGRPSIMIKVQDGEDIPLTQLTGTTMTRFPFDRIHAVAHDGTHIWLTTDIGLIRFIHASHGDIGKYELFRPGTPDDVAYVRFPDMAYRLVTRIQGTQLRYLQFDRDSQTWLPLTVQDGFNPMGDRTLIGTPLWQWTATGDRVTVTFTDPALRGQPVFNPDDPAWRFRFDDIRGIAAYGSELLLVSDGLLCQYTLQDTTLSLNTMTPAPGPALSSEAHVRLTMGHDNTIYLGVEDGQRDMRIYRSRRDPTGRHFEIYTNPRDPFAVETLIDDGAWRWEMENDTGRVRKYILAPDGARQPFYMANGRFDFDDMQSFTVAGNQIWIATSGGIARYPLKGSSLQLHALQLESRIAEHDHPVVSQINIKNSTVYCELKDQGTYARPLNRPGWRVVRQDENPWLRIPVSSSFWTWTHDVKRRNVEGEYRDVHNNIRPVSWSSGMFDFDAVSDVVWHDNTVWLSSAGGLIGYPKHKAYLDIDSLRVYPSPLEINRLITVPDARPAPTGLYTGIQDRMYRLNPAENRWQELTVSGQPDTTGYSWWRYLHDRFRYDTLIDYDGFWRGRRRLQGEDATRLPNVILETYTTGVWQRVSIENGRFDFDIIHDFVIDGSSMWLATRAGICRYDLLQTWLDLRHMTPLWGPKYSNATDLRYHNAAGTDRLTIRRGRNNNTVLDLDIRTSTITPIPALDSPFTRTMLVDTGYWRWVRLEQYRGSVAHNNTIVVEMRTASGAWTPLQLTGDRIFFPFDIIHAIAYYRNAVWTATPMGIFQYPADRPFSIANTVFHWSDGRLEHARRLTVSRTDNQPERLICEIGKGSLRRMFYLDTRTRWREMAGKTTLEDFRFREDQWYWYEVDGRVEIRYRNDPAKPRPLFNRHFADHYIHSVTSDHRSLWCLTPGGLFRYEGRVDGDSLHIIHWYTDGDIEGGPPGLQSIADISSNSAESHYSIMRIGEELWMLTARELIRYRILTQTDRLAFVARVPLPDMGMPFVGGHLYKDRRGRVLVILAATDAVDFTYRFFSLNPQSNTLQEERHIMRYQAAIPASSIVAFDEEPQHVWVAAPDGLYRIRKSGRGIKE